MNSRLRVALSLTVFLGSACGGASQPDRSELTGASSGQSAQMAAVAAPVQTAGMVESAPAGPAMVMPVNIAMPSDAQPKDPASCSSVNEQAERIASPVDIIWVVDASPSMLDEQDRINQNLQGVATDISNASIDYRVIILTSVDLAFGTPLGDDAEHYLFLPTLVGSNDALIQLLAQYPNYKDFLRPQASTHFIVVTDDNSLLPAADFKTDMEATLGKSFTQHAIASESTDGGFTLLSACLGAFSPGTEYYALADSTGGQAISICTQDWSMVFGPLREAVIASAPLPCSFPIPPPPPGQNLDPSLVNVDYTSADGAMDRLTRTAGADACADANAWYYDNDAAPSAVELCPAACERISAGGNVDIAFGCETLVLE